MGKEPKNLCRNCGQDFYRVEQFDAHRADFKIRGVNQVLTGDCIPGEILGYVAEEGVWYDAEGLRTRRKLVAAINRRWAKGVGDDGP